MSETIAEREVVAERILSLVKRRAMDGEDVYTAMRGHDQQQVLWTIWRLIDENRLRERPNGTLEALP